MAHPRGEPSDGEVVRGVLAGDRELFGLLVARYGDLLYRHAERMTGYPDEAEDVVQRAFVKGFRQLDRCRDPERVGSWLFRIGANLCKDWLKSRRRRDLPLEEAHALSDREGNPSAAPHRGDLLRRIEEALARLPAEQREAFVLKHLEGWSYEEMAELLDVSVPALKMRVHRAREGLQDLLGAYR